MYKIKTAANYIETVYGTRPFARSLVVQDAQSVMDLMQDFTDYNVKQSTKPLLDALGKIAVWDDDLEDEYGDPGVLARIAIAKALGKEIENV